MNYKLIFDKIILKQLQKTNKTNKIILNKIFNKLEEKGSTAGKLIDNKYQLYEIKMKRPPLRVYFRMKNNSKILVFEIEMKKSKQKQKKKIQRLKNRLSETNIFSRIFFISNNILLRFKKPFVKRVLF